MERVLKAVPADLRVKMEALVHDLTLALEESSNSANLRRRWGIRRRARSTGNIRKCKGEQFHATLKTRSNKALENITEYFKHSNCTCITVNCSLLLRGTQSGLLSRLSL